MFDRIAELVFPEELQPAMSELAQHMAARATLTDLLESGAIDPGVLSDRLSRAYFTFQFIAELNEVIENLNLIVMDIGDLPTRHVLWRGSAYARFHLLLRSYFHEFYRLREIVSRLLKKAKKRGYIDREDVRFTQETLRAAIGDAIWLRNLLVHGSPTWKGQLHFDLNVLHAAHSAGGAIKMNDTGEVRQVKDGLAPICAHYEELLATEGNRASAILQKIADALHKTIDLAD
jgi:hypothetical protein